MAIPGAVIAQNVIAQNAQAPDQYSKPSPNIQMQGPNDQGAADQDSADQNADQDAADRRAAANGNQPTGSSADQPSVSRADGPRLQRFQTRTNQTPALQAPAHRLTHAGSGGTNGVARISLIHGDVSTQRGDSKDWSAAALNAPVLAGDRFYRRQGSHRA